VSAPGVVSHFDAVVVGAGFAGLTMLFRLREIGLSVRVIERGSGVGGTWFWNRYPGARVDVPSMHYSLAIDPNLEQDWNWPETFSAQADLERYANHIADRFHLRSDIQFDTTLIAATYDEDRNRWWVGTDGGDTIECKYLISAAGCLSATNVPDFAGLESFGGSWYHTSRWPREGVDLTGKVVGIVGTGSTGIQAVPVLAEQVKHLYVFQRTANFSVPSKNKKMDPDFQRDWKTHYDDHRKVARLTSSGLSWPEPPTVSALEVSVEERNRVYEDAWINSSYTPLGLLRGFSDIATNLEANETCAEFVRNKIRQIVKDQQVAELLCPKDHPIGTKRICVDDGYYETFNRPNVTLVDVRGDPIAEVVPTGLRTTATQYDLDVLVFATGFDAMTGPLLAMNIVGRDGLTLRDKWNAGPVTYLGLQTVGFPNLFMITGPGSPSVLANMTTCIEQHVEWVRDAIEHMEHGGLVTMEPDAEAEDRWVHHVNEVADFTLFKQADSWYLGANIPGKPRVFMPYVGGFGNYRAKCDQVVEENYAGFSFT